MVKKKNRFIAIGWVILCVALTLVLMRTVSNSYPGDGIGWIVLILIIIVVIIFMIAVAFGQWNNSAFSIFFGAVLCPGLLILALLSCFYIGPYAESGWSVVVYPDSDPNKAKVVDELISFDPFEYSAVAYKVYELTVFTGHVSVEYNFNGDALKFHKLYYGKKDEFQSTADSALTIVINQSAEHCLGEFRNIQICYLLDLLSDWPLPENVVLTGKIGLGSSTFLSSIVTD